MVWRGLYRLSFGVLWGINLAVILPCSLLAEIPLLTMFLQQDILENWLYLST